MTSPAGLARYLIVLLCISACSDPDNGSTAVPSPTIESFTAEPATIVRGQSAVLAWQLTGASGLLVEDGDAATVATATGADALDGSVSVTPTTTTTYTLRAAAESDGQLSPEVTAEVTVTVVDPPEPTVTLAADPQMLAAGMATTLSWTSTEAQTLALTANGEDVPLGGADVDAGSIEHSPEETTVYVLTATGPGGDAVAETTVTVLDPPTVESLGADPTSIALGQSSVLSWETSQANTVAILANDEELETGLGANGNLEVTPTDTTTYTLLATGPGGEARSTVEIEVDRTLRVTLDGPASIDFGASADLNWTTTAADSLALVAEPGGEIDIADKDIVVDGITLTPEATTTYTLTAGQGELEESAVLTVVVNPPVAITSLTATPSMVFTGEDTTIAWETENATRVLLRYDETEEEVAATGDRDFVGLTQGTTYTIVAEGVGGPVEQSVEVEVTDRPIPVVGSFTVTPDSIGLDQTATLSWEVERAETLRIRGTQIEGPDIDIPVGNDQLETGSVEVNPFITTHYTLTAINEHGMVTAEVDLEVPLAIAEFGATPDAIRPGDEVEISWRVQGAYGMELTIDGEEVLDAGFGPDGRGSTSLRGNPPMRVQIRARAENQPEVVEVITVDGLGPQIESFETDRDEVGREGLANLSWLTTRGITDFQLVASPAVGDGFEIPVDEQMWEDGTSEVTPRFDTRYVINISSDFGFTFAFIQVRVPLRILEFESVPSPAVYGEDVELRWTVQGAEGVEYAFGDDEPIVGFVGENGYGTGELVAVTEEGPVELTAFVGENGRVTGELEIEIAAPTVEAFTAAPDVGERGDTFRLDWRTRGGASIALEATDGRGTYAVDVADLNPSEDFLEVQVDFTTSYRLTVLNPFGQATSVAVVTLSDETPEIGDFAPDPANVNVGESATLSWETAGATRGRLHFYEDAEYLNPIESFDIDVGDLDDGSFEVADIQDFVYAKLEVGGVEGRAEANLVVGITGEPGTLQVSEVFYDAVGPDEGLQWVELYNAAPFPVNLADTTMGWGLGDWTEAAIALPTFEVPAFGCVVVAGPNSAPENYDPVIDAPFVLPAPIPNAGQRAAGLGLFTQSPDELQPGTSAFDGVVYGDELQEGDIFDIQGADILFPFVEEAPPGSSLHRIVMGGFGVNGEEEPGKDEAPEEFGIDVTPEFYVLGAPTPGRCYGLGPADPEGLENAQLFEGRQRGPEMGRNVVGLRTYNASVGDTQVYFDQAVADCEDDFRSGGLRCTAPAGTGRVDLTIRKDGQGEIVYPDWYEYEPVDFCNLQFPLDAFVGRGETQAFYGQVYEENVTEAPGDSGAFVVQWGVGPEDGDAAFTPDLFTWFDATFNVQDDNNDEYQVLFLAEEDGEYRHAFRVRLQNGDIWTYCDRNGTVNNAPELLNFFEADQSGTLEVSLPQ